MIEIRAKRANRGRLAFLIIENGRPLIDVGPYYGGFDLGGVNTAPYGIDTSTISNLKNGLDTIKFWSKSSRLVVLLVTGHSVEEWIDCYKNSG